MIVFLPTGIDIPPRLSMSTIIVIILPPSALLTGSLYEWKLASVSASANRYLQAPKKLSEFAIAECFVKNVFKNFETFLASLALPLEGLNASLILYCSKAGFNSLGSS